MSAASATSRKEPQPERVAVLLATRNGEAFLDEQMRSLEAQTYPVIDIWASDDGSTDRTVAILKRWREEWTKGSFHILAGPEKGFAENFRSLLLNEAIDADYIAFCDQDDLWQAGKLEKSLAWMRMQEVATPLLFCSRTLNISSDGEELGLSPLFSREPSFRNALVQSLAGGNTMVLNRAGFECLRRASRRIGFVSHDWWAYLIITGVGGMVAYTDEPLVLYRQHAANLVGSNTSWGARAARVKFLLHGRFAGWNDINLRGLECNRDMLTPDALAALEMFRHVREGGFFARLADLARSGLYRQTVPGTLGLWLAVAMRRI